MMNCFKARPLFVAFWRGTLDTRRREELLAHLKGCSKCDRAFRAFALTAPMLYPKGAETGVAAGGGSAAPMDMSGRPRADASRAAEIMRRASVYRLQPRRAGGDWRGAIAAVSAVAAAVLLAYFSVAAPPQSLNDALSGTESISETAAQPGTQFFGQQIPGIPTVTDDLAE